MSTQWQNPSHKLPEPQTRVLVAVKTKYGRNRSVTVAEYIPGCTVLAEDFMSEDSDPDFMEIGDDGKEYVPEGWWESLIESGESFLIDGEVMYWMDIPRMPYWI